MIRNLLLCKIVQYGYENVQNFMLISDLTEYFPKQVQRKELDPKTALSLFRGPFLKFSLKGLMHEIFMAFFMDLSRPEWEPLLVFQF
jgi:hypothetical protein